MNLQLNSKKPLQLTLLVMIVTTALRLWAAAGTGLGIGEAYYFRGAVHLDLSYYDQPPLFFWLSGISIRLLGLTNFALRLPAIIMFVGTMWLMFTTSRRLFNAWAGFFAVVLLNISFVFTIPVASWFQPDAPLMFFWMLCTWLLTSILFPRNERSTAEIRNNKETYTRWILVGIVLGLTTLSKYHAGFLLAGTFLFVVFSKTQRHWLWHPGPYIAIVLTILVSAPIFIWNMQHDWASFAFQGGRAGSGGEFEIHFNWFLRSLVGQMFWLAPWIWVPLVIQLYRTYKNRISHPPSHFFFWTAILPIGFFTIITLWANTQFHFHWQAPGYMMLFIPLGYSVYRNIETTAKKRKLTLGWLIGSAAFTVIFGTVLLVHTETGFWQNNGPRDIVEKFGGDHDPTIEAVDYDEIKTRFEKEGWLNDPDIFIGSIKWWQTGKIDWALKGKKKMVIFHHDPRNYAYFYDPKDLLGKDAIVIAQNEFKQVKRHVEPFFDSIRELEPIDIKRNEITEISLHVYYCENFKVPEKKLKRWPLYHALKEEDNIRF